MATAYDETQDPMWPQREATKINLALGGAGMDDAATTRWWNHRAYEELGGYTPLQAWQRQEYVQVKTLVERLLSQRFAEHLPDSPLILGRLEQSQS
jgi:hypothetical protein